MKKKSENKAPYDFINPNHYKNSSKEVWEMMVDIWGKDAFILHCEMCSFKYRQRLGLKPNQPIERDLEKAKWYEDKAKELLNDQQSTSFFNELKCDCGNTEDVKNIPICASCYNPQTSEW